MIQRRLVLPIETARNELKRLGFVHVTGLTWDDSVNEEDGEVQAAKHELCKWHSEDGMTVAVMENGEVWIMDGEPDAEGIRVLRRICPCGRSYVQVPGANGRIIYYRAILARTTDPNNSTYGDPTPRPVSIS